MVELMIFFSFQRGNGLLFKSSLFKPYKNNKCFQRLEWIKKCVGACSLCLLLGLAWLGLNHFFHLLQTQRFCLVKILQLFFCFSSAAAKVSLNAQWRTRNQKGLKGEFLWDKRTINPNHINLFKKNPLPNHSRECSWCH